MFERSHSTLSEEIKHHHMDLTLCADILLDCPHVYRLLLCILVTISSHLHFGMIEYIHSLDHSSILAAIINVITIYHNCGLSAAVKWLLTHRAFEHLCAASLTSKQINFNLTTAANLEYAPEKERII